MAEDVRDNFDSPRNPVKVLRLKCRDCTNNQIAEIDNCTIRQCPVWPWRFGKNPYRIKKVMSEGEKERVRVRFAKLREKT